MRAIIIEEDRFAEISDLMKLKVMELSTKYSHQKPQDLTDQQWAAALEAAHRTMHYYFVTWAQSHGASCVRR